MEKDLTPYEIALALKELGFNEPCFCYYYNRELSFGARTSYGEVVEVPTFSQAFRFFREKYKLQTRFVFKMISETEFEYSFMPNDLKNKWYKTYEEAELECLIRLIELVKQ